MMEYPEVSVCIPAYNYGHYLPDAIESVLNQTFKDIELIVVDNCSSDDTPHIVALYSILDPRVKYFCNDTNIGLVGNLNRCLEHARGKYIKILCADDVLEPTCLEKSVDIMEQYKNVELVSVARWMATEDLHPVKPLGFTDGFMVLDGPEAISRCLLYGNQIGEPTAVLFRRKSAGRGFDARYKQIDDLEMWFRLLESGDLAHIPEPLCRIRQHGVQDTNRNIKLLAFADEEFMLLNEYLVKEYVTLSCFNRQRARYNRAYLIWDLGSPYSWRETLSKISRHCNPVLFFLFFGIKKSKIHFVAHLRKWIKYLHAGRIATNPR
jgi:glycosyltransferase involved in cell wall biosynthesis